MTDNKTPDKDQVATSLPTARNNLPGNMPQATDKQAWLRRFWPLLLSTGLSLSWIGVCIWWFMETDKTIARMPLYEVGGLLAGASLPLVLIWLIALVYLRADPLRDHRMALAHGLDGLLAPLDVAQRRVNAIVTELHKEISHIEAAGDIATKRIDNLENRFQLQISNLFEVTTDAEAKAANLQATLSSEREAFSSLVTEVTAQITELETMFKQLKFDSESITDTIRNNSEKVSNEITFQNKTLDERSRLIEGRLEKMAVDLVNMSRDISENCVASEDRLSSIGQLLAEKQASLTETLAGLSDHANKICDKMADQSKIIAELSQKTAAESEKVTATILQQATSLSTVAEAAVAKTTESGDTFQAQAEAMAKKLDEVTEKSRALLDEASEFFKSNAAEIVQSSQTLSDNLIGHMGRATADLYAKSETLEHTVAVRVSTTQEALETQAEIIRSKLIEQSREIQASLDQHSGKASEFIINQGSELAENMAQQFTGLIEQMKKQTDQLEQLAGETTNKLEDTVSSIEAQAKRVDAAVTLTTDSLNKKTGLMNSHYESFEQLTEKFRAQVDQSEAQLKTQHDDLVKSISDVAEHLEGALQKLKNESGSLGEHAQEIINSIVGQTEHLSEHIDDIRDRTENTIRNIQDMGETVSSHFTATDAQAAALSENWLKTATLVENQCAETLSRLDELAIKLAELEKENARATDHAENNVSKVADQMQNASESIYLASASAIEAADETNRVIDQHAEKFQQLINAIQLSNKSILIDAEAIEQKIREKNSNHFSNLASNIIEQLQSLSIDINRYLEEDVPDKIWQSYVDGDKNAFIRRLKKLTNKKHVAAIGEKYKSDHEFRKHALEYMQTFEDLMSQSMASDNYSAFSVALISSETGKIYLALAQAVNRLS